MEVKMIKPVRFLLATLALVTLFMVAASQVAFAGNPHFVDVTATQNGNTLTVSGKEAGLGNEAQVHIVVSATALCINNGGNHPRAVNKTSASAEGDFPVQNGKAEFSLTLTATFQPECSPPMTVTFTNITVEDTTHGVTAKL
jgi:phage tail sheath gpL-like